MNAARRLISTGLVSLGALVGILALAGAPALAAKEYFPGVPASFGVPGSGPGQFSEPAGVAVNDSTEPLVQPAAGDVYVVDKGNDRVERFSATGGYLGEFNGSGTLPGEGAAAPTGRFSAPNELAVDNSTDPLDPSAGDVYVQDAGHQVIDKFSSTGGYLGQLKETSGGLLFHDQHGVAVDPSGNLWVYNERNDEGEVDEFSDTGGFVKAFNTGLAARDGLAVDSAGNIYAMCCSASPAKFVSATGQELAVFGTVGNALAVDPATNDLFVDEGHSIQEIGTFGEPLTTFPAEGLSESQGIAVTDAGEVYASQDGANDVEIS